MTRAGTKRSLILLGAAFVGLLGGCVFTNNSDNDGNRSEEYRFSAWFLDTYLIYREKLPSDLGAFSTPKGLYRAVNEPFTEYYTPAETKVFLSYLTTQAGGIGIRLDSIATGYLIKEVFSASPGESAGLLAGDIITAIDNNPVVGVTWKLLRSLLAGNIGEIKQLDISRGAEAVRKDVRLGTYSAPSVFVDSLDSTTALITLTAFFTETNTTGGSAAEFRNALQRTAWADYTILDLQQNGGGELSQCVDIVEELVVPGTNIIRFTERVLDTITFEGYSRDTTWRTDSGGSAANRNLLILVDSLTASASEIVVSCVKTARPQVKVIGTNTYGKARAQVLSLGPDSGLAKVTYATIKGVNGLVYDLVGIAPDIAVGPGQDALTVATGQIGSGLGKVARATNRRSEALRQELQFARRPPMAVKWRNDDIKRRETLR